MAKSHQDSKPDDSSARNENESQGNPTPADDIPPVHVLEAAQEQERQEARDLIAGFNRPPRTRDRSADNRDFVDYYGSAERSDRVRPVAPVARPAKTPSDSGESNATVLTRRKKNQTQWRWVGLVALMLLFGVAVAFVATSGPPSTSRATVTVTSAPLLPPPVAPSIREQIPDPDPADRAPEPVADVDVARTPPRRSPKKVPSEATGASSTLRLPPGSGIDRPPNPRDDFIRDF